MTDVGSTLRQQTRDKFRSVRRSLAPRNRATASNKICAHIETFFEQKKLTDYPLKIAAYLNSDYEVSLHNWVAGALEKSTYEIFIPIVDQSAKGNQGKMSFHRYRLESETQLGKYGIRTLINKDEAAQINAAELDYALVPLVAFDLYGTRLGMGGGYYDRFFSNKAHRPYLLGVGFEVQLSERPLERASWDIALDAIVTQKGITHFEETQVQD
jgi:5-formyltetrahydrofolate cyclo-ligase